jgi:hypothetical protein
VPSTGNKRALIYFTQGHVPEVLNAKATAAFNGEDYWSTSVHETMTGSTSQKVGRLLGEMRIPFPRA